jgi:hypothetical protein
MNAYAFFVTSDLHDFMNLSYGLSSAICTPVYYSAEYI